MEGGRVESGRADGETRKKGRGGDEEGWGANTSNWPPWSKKLFQPPSFCLTETFYTGQLTEAGCISANAVFLSTRGWLRFIFFLPLPLYLLPYRRKLWEPVFRDNSPTCLRIWHPGPQVYEMDPFLRGRIPVVRFHGFLASLFTQTGSTGTWHFFEEVKLLEIWVNVWIRFWIARSHLDCRIEFKKWHQSKIDVIISK